MKPKIDKAKDWYSLSEDEQDFWLRKARRAIGRGPGPKEALRAAEAMYEAARQNSKDYTYIGYR